MPRCLRIKSARSSFSVLCWAAVSRPNSETVDSGYFALDELPFLCDDKNTREQVEMCFEASRAENWKTRLD